MGGPAERAFLCSLLHSLAQTDPLRERELLIFHLCFGVPHPADIRMLFAVELQPRTLFPNQAQAACDDRALRAAKLEAFPNSLNRKTENHSIFYPLYHQSLCAECALRL